MKNFIKLFSISVFIGIFVFFLTLRSEASKVTVNETSSGFAESSQTLYINNCARCHGADGKSETTLGKLNGSPDISGGKARKLGNKKLTRIITNGAGSMPGFGKKLSKSQIASLVRYVRGL